MQTYQIPKSDLEASRIAYGCMGLGGRWDQSSYTEEEVRQASQLVNTALEQGINFFDHANIYSRGKAEAVFGEVLKQKPGLREQMIIQSKCGIRFKDDPEAGVPGRYDFSYEHIMEAVEGSLRRLQTDHLDILLLHRPDALVEPEEVARAFDELEQAGKVLYFGVSNHATDQIELLKRYVDQPFVVNQLELSLLHNGLINEGVIVNQNGGVYTAAAGTLDYCRLNDILVQAWSPVARGHLFKVPEGADARTRAAAEAVAQLAEAKGTTKEAIALAWLLRHPAGIQPIVGTTNVEHLIASCEADEVTLSREEWYTLFQAGRGAPMP